MTVTVQFGDATLELSGDGARKDQAAFFNFYPTWFSRSRRIVTSLERTTNNERIWWLASFMTATSKPRASLSSLAFLRTDNAARVC